MNKTGFYLKMAWSNITKNQKFYVPYILTSILAISMFYTIRSFTLNSNLPNSSSFRQLMGFGIPVVLLFCVIFLFYTNSFLIRRRKTEFGLYNILGMEKRHISFMIVVETVMVEILSLGFGVAVGVLLNKLLFLILDKILDFETPMVFEFSWKAIIYTVEIFVLIYLGILIKNIVEVLKVKPIELLKAEKSGEREPKAKWPITIFGILCLGSGYYLALTCTNAYQAIVFFFVAVILVIIGTYCLFLTGSITILKLLKNNKKYYYVPKHFVSLSGMLYRMKQNAVGLANICILSTMVIVMIATTLALYVGKEEVVDTRYPYDINISCEYSEDKKELINKFILETEEETGLSLENYFDYQSVLVSLMRHGLNTFNVETSGGSITVIEAFTKDNYEKFYGVELPNIEKGYVAIATASISVPDSIDLLGDEYQTQIISKHSKAKGVLSLYAADSMTVVFNNEEDFNKFFEAQNKALSENGELIPSAPTQYYYFDVKGGDEEEQLFYNTLQAKIANYKGDVDLTDCNLGSHYFGSAQFNEFTGSFLFLGVFLGILFIAATVLIIYYKQIIEGYDDKQNFEIMQKVGMDKAEVKRSIRSQIIVLFYLPLVVAIVHMCCALPMLRYLLTSFAIYNVTTLLICAAITVLIYAICYAIVYSLTAKTYYKIVS